MKKILLAGLLLLTGNIESTITVDGTIIVNMHDKIKPTLVKNAPYYNNFFISQITTFNFIDNVIANDNIDGDITNKVKIDLPMIKNPGYYPINYSVRDRAGNFTELNDNINIWGFIKVESGEHHSLALNSLGEVYSWGRNLSGQLGNGTLNNNATPTIVKGLPKIIDIAASRGSSYALDENGQLYSWGYNAYGKLGDGTLVDRFEPVKVKQKEDVKFIKINANYLNAGALSDKGELYTWGFNGYGADGSLIIGDKYLPNKIEMENIKDFSLGNDSGALITLDNELYTFGSNYYGQLGTNEPLSATTHNPRKVELSSEVLEVKVGVQHMLARCSDGNIYSWGSGTYGKLGTGDTRNSSKPLLIENSLMVAKLYAAETNSAILYTDGTIKLFGSNEYNKLGLSGSQILIPTLNSNLQQVNDFALGHSNTIVIEQFSEVKALGLGIYGNLGNNSFVNTEQIQTCAITIKEPF